jgi:hypothetical protein
MSYTEVMGPSTALLLMCNLTTKLFIALIYISWANISSGDLMELHCRVNEHLGFARAWEKSHRWSIKRQKQQGGIALG